LIWRNEQQFSKTLGIVTAMLLNDMLFFVRRVSFECHLCHMMAKLTGVRRFLDSFPRDTKNSPKRFRANLYLMRGCYVGQRWRHRANGQIRYAN
jgi:hypothetical protein